MAARRKMPRNRDSKYELGGGSSQRRYQNLKRSSLYARREFAWISGAFKRNLLSQSGRTIRPSSWSRSESAIRSRTRRYYWAWLFRDLLYCSFADQMGQQPRFLRRFKRFGWFFFCRSYGWHYRSECVKSALSMPQMQALRMGRS